MNNEICGVGLILNDGQGRILVVRELRDKPLILKEAGMLSFPLETVKEGEDPGETVYRLLQEEIGIVNITPPTFFGGTYRIVPHAITLACTARIKGKITGAPSDGTDTEVVGWMTPEELLKHPCRREVAPIMADYVTLCREAHLV